MNELVLSFKKISIILLTVLCISQFSTVAFAKDKPKNDRPSVTYNSTGEFNKVEKFGPWPPNKWSIYATANTYTSWDKDAFEAINYKANISLSTTSTTKYELTGSTEFGIKKIAQVQVGGTFGKEWGKTSTVSFDAPAGYVYELWSANKRVVYKYTYPSKGKTTKYSKAYGNDGTYKWFFRYKR
ncbi:hypothetical protein PF011_g27396 [Phytophthora fragariae]|uniref:Uncharacterized protein n=1 Tax=Phytophthora fragariae TaxID=53985 RepID=A0A6A3HH71_9STRA|nr:hypothetical protein PF011_g27396 [Phytophthora fragariae]